MRPGFQPCVLHSLHIVPKVLCWVKLKLNWCSTSHVRKILNIPNDVAVKIHTSFCSIRTNLFPSITKGFQTHMNNNNGILLLNIFLTLEKNQVLLRKGLCLGKIQKLCYVENSLIISNFVHVYLYTISVLGNVSSLALMFCIP